MELRQQGIRYLIAGAYNTAFGYVVFAVANLLFGDDISYLILLVPAQILAVLNAFLIYRYLVFKVRGTFWRDLARFSTVYVAMLGVNLAVLPLFVEVFGIPVLLAQAIVLFLTVVSSFFAHRNFSFRRPAVGATADPDGL